jgi:pyrroline-5-carboxylate reductase
VSRILLVGCGKMGAALLEGWLDQGIAPQDIRVVEPGDAAKAAFRPRRVEVVASDGELTRTFQPDIVVLAVKPQAMDAVLPPYARFGKAVFLSIAAGKTISYFERMLGDGAAIVRSMPNTPAAVRRGMTVACANARVGSSQRYACGRLLEAVGEVAWVADEALMDAVTAVSGSGPAYVFLLAECLAQAGAEAGLPPELAARLARVTVAGSGELLHRSSEPAEVLRQNVTSPGGTTFAALQVLMADEGMRALFTRAVAAAAARSRELAG